MAEKGPVCVTGASGFIASWLIKVLLEKGYIVHGTVRNPNDTSKVSHLLNLPHANERLRLFQADLLKEGSFDAAIENCHGVFHTASPFFYENVTDPKTQLIDPAVKGTLNVLNSVLRSASSSVKRVVLTSSIAAIWWDPNRPKTQPVNECCWSDTAYLEETKGWYALSKTLAEKTAFEFIKQNQNNQKSNQSNEMELISINPGLVLGPLLQTDVNTSSNSILGYCTGKKTEYPNSVIAVVHVDDVAKAHLLAYENPEAEGRYLCIESFQHWKHICECLQAILPEANITNKCADDKPLALCPLFTNEKLRKLGLEFQSLEAMLKDTVSSLKRKGCF